MPSVVCLSLCYADAYFVDWNGRNRCCFSLSLAGTMACEFVTPTASPKVLFAGTFIEPPEVMISPAIAIQGALCCSPIILSPWNAGFPRIIWFLVSCVFLSSSYSSCCFHPTWNYHPYRSTYVSGLCKYLHELVNIKMPWHTGAWEVTPGSAAQVVRQKLLTNMSPQLQSEVCTEMNLAIRQVAMEDLRIGRNLAKVQKNELFFPNLHRVLFVLFLLVDFDVIYFPMDDEEAPRNCMCFYVGL